MLIMNQVHVFKCNFAIIYIFGLFCVASSSYKPVFTEEELKKRLTPLQYHVTQEKGTEQ